MPSGTMPISLHDVVGPMNKFRSSAPLKQRSIGGAVPRHNPRPRKVAVRSAGEPDPGTGNSFVGCHGLFRVGGKNEWLGQGLLLSETCDCFAHVSAYAMNALPHMQKAGRYVHSCMEAA